MKKKFLFLYVVLTFLSISFFFVSNIVNNNDLYEKNETKTFHIVSEQKNNFLLSISFYLIKPIIENYIDSRFKNNIFIKQIEKENFLNKAININDIKIGDGESVICGQNVSILITEKDGKTKKDEFKIGNNKNTLLNVGVIGMKKGGVRTIDFQENFIVNMIDVLEKKPENLQEIRVFSNRELNKKAYMCGEEVKISYKIKTIYGREILSSITNFKIGSGKVPIAIEQGSLEIQKENERIVITPRSFLKTTSDMQKDLIDLFKKTEFTNDLYILEILLL